MRGLLVVAVLASAGCLQTFDGDGGHDLADAGVFVVEGGAIRRSDDAPWVEYGKDLSGDNTTTLDWVQLLEPDRLHVILVQALQDIKIDIDVERRILYSPDPIGGEGGTASDFCLFEMQEHGLAGDALLDRALGKDVKIPDRNFADRNASWMRFGGSGIIPTDYGLFGGSGLGGHLDQGTWLAFSVGSSGIPATQLRGDEQSWTVTIGADGPVRILVLPPALFLCGAGFSRFGGTTVPPGVAYRGGERDVQDLYGITVSFDSDAQVIEGVPVALTGSAGALRFGDERVQLTDSSNVWRTTYQPLVGSIQVEQWVGNPFWWIVGYPIPHPPELGMDGGNATAAR